MYVLAMILLSAVLLVACTPAPAPADTNTNTPTGTPTSTTDTGTASTGTTAWANDPPADAARGSISRWKVNCGLFDGVWEIDFMKGDDEKWHPLLIPPEAIYPEMVPCLNDGEQYLIWHPDGMLEVYTDPLYHELFPTKTEHRWLGTVWPLENTPQCAAGVAALGLTWPVHLSMTMVDLTEPED